MHLEHLIRFGYVLVVVSFLLMVWASLTGAETPQHQDPPCGFNALCSCSKMMPDLGMVRCVDMHLPRVPEIINVSKVFTLHLENNALRSVEPYFFQSTGLYKLTIKENLLTCIPDESFVGLERSLWELDLSQNHISDVPYRSLRNLQKLRVLDLSGNEISRFIPENWRGLDVLEELVLRDNSIRHLPPDSFSGLPKIETIDLSGNNLKEIDPTVFRDGMDKLANLLLSDNQLSVIPYQALAPLKHLKILDLGFNVIKTIMPNISEEGSQPMNLKMNLDLLKLDYNLISILESDSYQNFDVLNTTILDGNQISYIEAGAFKTAKLKEIYLKNCGLTQITPEAFEGVENYLEVLDLSGNDIKSLMDGHFARFQALRVLSLQDNMLNNLIPKEALVKGLQFTLQSLDLSGALNSPVSLQDLRSLRNLRHISVSRLSNVELSQDDFLEFGMDVETFYAKGAHLQTLKNNCFRHLRGVKTLDLSENSITKIEPDAFVDIRHSLTSLNLAHGFSPSYDFIQIEVLRPLTYLEHLDVSNNKIRSIPEASFRYLKRLQVLELQDNMIEQIKKGIFQATVHKNLKTIYFSFNNIRIIPQHIFVDLPALEQVHFDDNKVEKVETRAFMNLNYLKRVNLKGNRLSSLGIEAFQNLPELEDLDMAFNKLTSFDFAAFDQVGTLSYMFSVNVSHNKLTQLKTAADTTGAIGVIQSNIKVLDLSFNNISSIGKQFFRPAERSLIHLSVSHNDMFKVTEDVFGGIINLQWFDISYNRLLEIEENVFKKSRNLQIFDASHNLLGEIPSDLFRYLLHLRTIDVSHNRLNMLPDNIFREEGIESLDISHNQMHRIPLTSFSVAAASTLCNMDLSWNSISSVTNTELFHRFKSLNSLDLSHNKLTRIDYGVFSGVNKLAVLNLGHNSELELGGGGATFKGIEDTLLYLNLENISMPTIPELPLPNLIQLSLANNYLANIPVETAATLNSLRKLNLGYNDLTMVPIMIDSLVNLKALSLVNNMIKTLTNESFAEVADQLEELDIRNLELETFDTDTLWDLEMLKTLKLGTYFKGFKIPEYIYGMVSLRNLEIHAEKETNLGDEMNGQLPPKLSNITISGRGFKSLNSFIFKGLQSPTLQFTLRDTSISRVFSDLFRNAGRARNISVDVRGNFLEHLENPSTGSRPGLARRTFLLDLKMAGNRWSCDCDIGWVEIWHRKRTQYLCDLGPSVLVPTISEEYHCRHVDDDLRIAPCVNKANKSLVETFKTDLECGWSSAERIFEFRVSLVVSVLVTFLVILA